MRMCRGYRIFSVSVRAAAMVMTALAADSANSGSFSSTSQERLLAGMAPAGLCRVVLFGNHPLQRPVVPQQQNEREGDDLRLGEQSQRE